MFKDLTGMTKRRNSVFTAIVLLLASQLASTNAEADPLEPAVARKPGGVPCVDAPPLHADAATDPRGLAETVLASDTSGKLNVHEATQLLTDARELGASLASGAAQERWQALLQRQKDRLERRRQCEQRLKQQVGGRDPADSCQWLQGKKDDPPSPEPTEAEGILVVAGGVQGLSNAYVLLRGLRRVGCRLPVEVVYYGRGEYHGPTARLLLDLDGVGPGEEHDDYGWQVDDDEDGDEEDDNDDDGNEEDSGTTSSKKALRRKGGREGKGASKGAGPASNNSSQPEGGGAAAEKAGDVEAAADGAPGQCSSADPDGGGQQCDWPAAAGASQDGRASARPSVRLVDGLAYHSERLAPLAPHRELPGGIRGFATKVHALCFVTSFEKVLLLDADNLAVQDPTFLFDDPAFVRHGNLFWPDFWTDMWINLNIYRLLNMAVPWEEQPTALAAEAGQVMFDRVLHYDALEYLWLLATHPEVVGACVWGDKDTYRMAFHLAGKGGQYNALSHPPRQLLGQPAPGAPRLHHLGMAQLAPDGESIMFYHRTAAAKLFPSCIFRWANRMDACRPAWVSLPVDQPQLLASVSDPSEMVFQPGSVDTEWHKEHCKSRGGGGAGGQSVRLPACDRGWEGRRPIPLLPVESVPGFAKLADWVHSEVFLPLLEYHAKHRS